MINVQSASLSVDPSLFVATFLWCLCVTQVSEICRMTLGVHCARLRGTYHNNPATIGLLT